MGEESTGTKITRRMREELASFVNAQQGKTKPFPWMVLFSWLLPLVVAIGIAAAPLIHSDGIEAAQVNRLIQTMEKVEDGLAALQVEMAEYKVTMRTVLATQQDIRQDQERLLDRVKMLESKGVNDRVSIRTLQGIMENIQGGEPIKLAIDTDLTGQDRRRNE
jgi:FtsZ-binding cell division protein ZapB